MFATILKLFGCSPQSKNNDNKLDADTLSQLAKSVEEFKNRPIHTSLTEDIISSTPDNTLLQVVFDNVAQKLPAEYEKEYATVLTWNKSRQAIYVIWLLEAEVNNGGYNQFYFNSSGQYYKLLPEALLLVGAKKFSDLTSKANQTFENENKTITKDQDGTIEGFSKSYDNNPLNKFDDEFYALYKIEDLQRLQVEYIRKHQEEFID